MLNFVVGANSSRPVFYYTSYAIIDCRSGPTLSSSIMPDSPNYTLN